MTKKLSALSNVHSRIHFSAIGIEIIDRIDDNCFLSKQSIFIATEVIQI